MSLVTLPPIVRLADTPPVAARPAFAPTFPRVRDALAARTGWVTATELGNDLGIAPATVGEDFGCLHDYGMATRIGHGAAAQARWDGARP